MKKIAIMAILWLFSRFRYCIRVVFDLHLHRVVEIKGVSILRPKSH